MMPTSPPFVDCPIARHRKRITSLTADMVRVLRQLRRDLKACPDCPFAEDCPILANLNAQVQAAIQTVNAEWDLGSVITREDIR